VLKALRQALACTTDVTQTTQPTPDQEEGCRALEYQITLETRVGFTPVEYTLRLTAKCP
jgi:hypothetical protein